MFLARKEINLGFDKLLYQVRIRFKTNRIISF
jgi:hypothetical protein